MSSMMWCGKSHNFFVLFLPDSFSTRDTKVIHISVHSFLLIISEVAKLSTFSILVQKYKVYIFSPSISVEKCFIKAVKVCGNPIGHPDRIDKYHFSTWFSTHLSTLFFSLFLKVIVFVIVTQVQSPAVVFLHWHGPP